MTSASTISGACLVSSVPPCTVLVRLLLLTCSSFFFGWWSLAATSLRRFEGAREIVGFEDAHHLEESYDGGRGTLPPVGTCYDRGIPFFGEIVFLDDGVP